MTYLTKKTAQGHDSFYKLNEEEVSLPNASPSIEIIDIQTPTLQKFLPFKNLGPRKISEILGCNFLF